MSKTEPAWLFIRPETKFTNVLDEWVQTSGETNVRSERERKLGGDIRGKVRASCDDYSETFAAK